MLGIGLGDTRISQHVGDERFLLRWRQLNVERGEQLERRRLAQLVVVPQSANEAIASLDAPRCLLKAKNYGRWLA